MNPKFDPATPLFLSIAKWLEDAILAGTYKEEEKVPSTTEIALSYNLNPATALKGVNMLVSGEILHKKRGLGMYVSKGAVRKLQKKRQGQFYDDYVTPLISEANRLQITNDDLRDMIENGIAKK